VKYADLHLHTVYSDSTYTPQELIAASVKAGLSAISVVDHDTVEGIAPTIAAAKKENIEVVPGIELSAEYEQSEVHILGYYVDCANKELLLKLAKVQQNRIDRIHKITEKLKELGLALEPDDVFKQGTGGTVGRLHVARAMVEKGLVSSTYEAFQKYLGDKGPAFFLGFRVSPQEAVSLIRNAGGVPVLAHPCTLHNDELILKFISCGIMGLEIYYPEHSQGMINLYLDIAKNYNLLVTGGSDCHGKGKSEVRIGSIKLPYELVEEIKAAKGGR